ncbi:MAG: serine/threonine protein kinase [Planctomycetes bacterium]|nr:serine/threonine protein kinase [Planctomycetota bacterium]
MPGKRDTDTPPSAGAANGAQANGAPAGGQKAQIFGGNYKLIKKLGQGGMGAVYLAHQISLDRPCAVKVLAKELAGKPAFVDRFLREARIMAKLDHPNILRCFEVNQAQGFHYLSMEFVDGGSIQDWLKKLGKFSIGDSLHIILACAHALHHAHELKLVHRDMKPDNVLLTKKGIIKVADLGLAKNTEEDMGLTKTGTGAGTPYYMAPEQARDVKHVDGRTDIYALGVMLYEFLTGGERPFKGTTLVEIIEAKEKGKFSPTRKFNAEVPQKLDLIIDKMLATKPEHRYQSCAEVILDLESLNLANGNLSFIEVEGPQSRTVTPPARRKITMPPTGGSTVPPSSTALPDSKPAPAPAPWYANFTGPDGKAVTRKLSTEQMQTLIKSESFSEQTQVSRTMKGGYRALGTYVEFAHLFKGLRTGGDAKRKTEKFQKFYDQIEKDQKSRERWRWLHNKFLGVGGFIGLVLWLVVILAVIGGLGYLAYMFFPDFFKRIGLG